MPRLNVMSAPIAKPNNSTKFFVNIGGLFRQVTMSELKKFIGAGSGGTGGTGGVSPEDLEGYVFVEEPDEGEEIGPVEEPILNAEYLGGYAASYFAPQHQISDAFSEEKKYLKNDYCIFENMLCKFISPKEPGPWDGTKIVVVSVVDEIQALHNANVFSYDEVRIGTWVDNKPLYRKMIDFGALPNVDEKFVDIPVNDIDFVYVNLGKTFWHSNSYAEGNKTSIFSPRYSDVETIWVYRNVGTGVNRVIVKTTTNFSSYRMTVCIEYTKTTDTANP